MPSVKLIDVPDQAAIDFLKGKLNITTSAANQLDKEANAKAFTIAGATKLDLLKDIREAVEKGIEDGESLGKFRKRFAEIVTKHGWEYNGKFGWRTSIIFNTNINTAQMAGRWDKIQQNKENRPYLMYRTAGDKRVRPEHDNWDRIILPVDHPFWKTHFPPNGWGCRCGIRSVSERDLEKKGWKITPQKTVDAYLADQRDNGDGFNGIDLGWDYNVGEAWKNRDKTTIKQASKALEKQFKDTLKVAKETIKIAPTAFSTVDGVSAGKINEVLVGLTEAKPQIDKLAEFINEKGIKALFLKQAELRPTNKAAKSISNDVNEYLGNKLGRSNYAHRKPTRVNGFTSEVFNHVIVKAGTKHKFRDSKISEIRQDLLNAVEKVFESGDEWSVSSSTTLPSAQLLITWMHEVGHHVHFWAESPLPPKKAVKMTQYSHANKFEYHAEHFVMWVLNRQKLEEIGPLAAKHFDNLIDKAIKSKIKKR